MEKLILIGIETKNYVMFLHVRPFVCKIYNERLLFNIKIKILFSSSPITEDRNSRRPHKIKIVGERAVFSIFRSTIYIYTYGAGIAYPFGAPPL